MKYFNINRRICGAVLAVIVACTGCKKDFLDVNDDPNRATDNNISAELIFPQAANGVGVRMGSANLEFIQKWVGYMSASGDFAIEQDETTYNVSFSFGDVLWQNNYNVLFDLYLTKQKALAAGDTVLAGASMILSARLWQDMVDIYGNIPYSQAFQTQAYRRPEYDKGQDIYAALQKSLDTAINYMKATTKASFKTIDVVNNADKTLWVKFANTLKLRMLIRQSEMNGFDPAAEISKITANGGVLEAGETIDVNPGYVNENNKQSPFYSNYGLTPTGAEASTSTRANNYFINLLLANADPRLERVYAPTEADSVIAGTDYGLPEGNPDGAHSSNMGPGLARSATQNQWIFVSFESMFLKAEAIARGWLPGNVQTAYEDAVTESFVWLGVDSAEDKADDYLADADIANWANAGASALEQARFIAFQKYIALCGVDPVEAWADIRRLNMMPDDGYLSHNPARLRDAIPVRLLYPQSEYTTNGPNVRAQGTINQFDTTMFWQP